MYKRFQRFLNGEFNIENGKLVPVCPKEKKKKKEPIEVNSQYIEACQKAIEIGLQKQNVIVAQPIKVHSPIYLHIDSQKM